MFSEKLNFNILPSTVYHRSFKSRHTYHDSLNNFVMQPKSDIISLFLFY